MPIPTIPLGGQVLSNGLNTLSDLWKTSKERYNSMTKEQKAEAARVGDQGVRDNVLPVVTTVGELIPQTSIPMAAYNTSEAVKKGNYEEAFQHALTPVLTGSVSKGVNLGLKASEKAVDAAGKALKSIRKETKAIIPIEKPIAKTIFRANVYKGGEIADPYNSFFTTDPEYAAQYGPVRQYIIEGKNPSVAKEPLIGYRDPVTMDMFVYRNIDNPESTIIIGKDAITKDIPYQSKGIEVLSYGRNNIKSIQKPKEITLDKAINISDSKLKYLEKFTKPTYISPKTSYKSIFMEEPIMGRGRPKKSSTEVPISPEAGDEMLFEDLIGEQGAINAARKTSQAGKRVLKPITEAEKLGIPKGERFNPKSLEDPYYWGYEQWNQRYNTAVESGNAGEVQRLRDLHFKVKAPDTKVVDENGNPLHTYHGLLDHKSPENAKKFTSFKGVNGDLEDAVKEGNKINHGKLSVPNDIVMHSYHSPNKEMVFKNYGRHRPDMVYDDYLNIKNPFTGDEERLYEILSPKYDGVKKSPPSGGHSKGNGTEYEGIPNTKPTYEGVSDGSYFGGPPKEEVMKLGHDGLYIPQYYDSYGAFVSPSQFKSADAITYDDFGNLIQIVKRDNFHNLDRRYKQGGKIKSIFNPQQ